MGNFTAEGWTAAPRVRRIGADGEVLATWCEPVVVDPDRIVGFDLPAALASPVRPDRELLVCDVEGTRQVAGFVPDREFDYPKPRIRVRCRPALGGTMVAVVAETLLRDALLRADMLDPAADAGQGLTTLLPGEQHEWFVRGGGHPIDAEAIAFPAFMSVGDAEARA
jgi:beta-mannosidase